MADNIPPTHKALREALELSEELLRNLELSDLPLGNCALKASRLARLLNDNSYQKVMEYEVSGYPISPDGVQPDIYKLGVLAGREFQDFDPISKSPKTYIFWSSIEQLEQEIKTVEGALAAARDPDVSVSSSNPMQMVWTPPGNFVERQKIRDNAARARHRLSSRRAFIYSYVMRRHYELKFSGIADDIFSRIRESVDSAIGEKVPDAVQKLSAVYENLQSENPEDWSNAAHSCRRILQDLADALYPPGEEKKVKVNNQWKTIKLGADNYVNRLIAFIEEHAQSERFSEIVGSHLSFIGDRLDSVFQGAQKGSHKTIMTRKEADRYVVYTYLVVGDILSLQ